MQQFNSFFPLLLILTSYWPYNSIKQNKTESSLTVSNSGTAVATNILLTLEVPSEILDKIIFSTENYTIKQESKKSLQLSIPRFANGEGSIISIQTLVNSSKFPEEGYTIHAAHDRGSAKIQSLDQNIKTEKRQAPSIQQVLSVLPMSGIFGYFGIRLLQVVIIFRKRRMLKALIIGNAIIGSVFLLISSSLLLATVLL